MKYVIFLFAMAISFFANAQTAEEYLNRGIEKFDRKDDKGAIRDLTKSIELAPTKKAYQIRGLIRCAVNEYSGALLDFNKAIELDPRSKDVYSIRGQARFQLKDYPGALQDLDRAIEYEPQEVENYYYRGRVKYSLKDFSGALPDLNKAIELNSQYQDAYRIRSLIKMELRDFSGASLDLQNADNVSKGIKIKTETEYKKNREEDFINKGLEKFDHANFTGAISEYNTAISFNPNNEKLYLLRADAWQRLKNYPKSIADYTKAIEMNPKQAESYNSRGLTKAMALDVKGACEDFKKAVALGDNSSADLIKEFCNSPTKTESPVSTTTPAMVTEQPQVTKQIVKSKFTDLREGGGTYHTIKINDQIWMSENLDVSTFINGDIIPEARTAEAWKKAGEEERPAWCYYNNDTKNGDYGKLYNWYTVHDSRGLASKGWHIPSDEEWTKLTNFLQEDLAVKKMKSSEAWTTPGNENQFAGLPGGCRLNVGTFHLLGTYAGWWSSNSSQNGAGHFAIYDNLKEPTRGDAHRASGLSVRCIKD